MRYPIPPSVFRDKSMSGYLSICKRPPAGKMGGKIKFKRRWLIIKDDRMYIVKKPGDTVAAEIVPLDSCMIDPHPPTTSTSSSTQPYSRPAHWFCLHFPGGVITLSGKSGQPEVVGSYILEAPTEHAKVDWMGAVLMASGWKGRKMGEYPYLSMFPFEDGCLPEKNPPLRAHIHTRIFTAEAGSIPTIILDELVPDATLSPTSPASFSSDAHRRRKLFPYLPTVKDCDEGGQPGFLGFPDSPTSPPSIIEEDRGLMQKTREEFKRGVSAPALLDNREGSGSFGVNPVSASPSPEEERPERQSDEDLARTSSSSLSETSLEEILLDGSDEWEVETNKGM
ncbi:hypothetical protein HK104_005744 [Borealophlyctis nickersoniae]|nr:hypothetical protein HK104_005744 [Borealophlyctis nickersoniae]